MLASVLALLGLGGYAIFGGGSPSRSLASTTSPRELLPAPRLLSLVKGRTVLGGPAEAPLPWPRSGEGAVAVLGSGLVARSPRQREVPIASVTKMMTALLVLRDHPLALGRGGPRVRVTRADVSTWVRDSSIGDSTVPVRAGEVLSEYQLLEALLIPSGDNIATLLAEWDAGSERAFVRKMNAEARSLGLDHTHYADASGVDPGSRSTAADQALLAAQLMSYPVVRRIVAYPSRPFPVAGTIWNYNPALGVDGIVGVKSGFTGAAQGCLVTAAYREVGGRSVLVIAVALGQPDGLYGAARADEALLARTSGALRRVRIVPAHGRVGEALLAWSRAPLPLVAPSMPATLVAWPGTLITTRLVESEAGIPVGAGPGARIATLLVRSSGGLDLSVPVVAALPIPTAPAGFAQATARAAGSG